MPLHDWTKVEPGIYHDFHQAWCIEFRNELNRGKLPDGFSALVEQRLNGPEPDLITVASRSVLSGGLATATRSRPVARVVQHGSYDAIAYARRANRVAIHHPLGEVVAVVEIVSPGNKLGHAAIDAFIDKVRQFLRQGVHVLLIDPFPPTSRDPNGLHGRIWEDVGRDAFELSEPNARVCSSYETAHDIAAYVNWTNVGEELPTMPLFLAPGWHVDITLESSYRATWESQPSAFREHVLSRH